MKKELVTSENVSKKQFQSMLHELFTIHDASLYCFYYIISFLHAVGPLLCDNPTMQVKSVEYLRLEVPKCFHKQRTSSLAATRFLHMYVAINNDVNLYISCILSTYVAVCKMGWQVGSSLYIKLCNRRFTVY